MALAPNAKWPASEQVIARKVTLLGKAQVVEYKLRHTALKRAMRLTMVSLIITTYVDAALAQRRRLDLMRLPGKLPDSMRDDSISPSDDWFGWKAIPSTVTELDLNALERETGLPFPPLYREFLRYRHFVDLTNCGVRFERHFPGSWANALRQLYFQSWRRERIVDVGLLPFGSESLMDSGPVCFDIKRRDASGDCPVVFWDHGWVGTEKEIRPMFSSSARMFECLSFAASNDLDFVYNDDSDDPAFLPKKQALLAEFLRLDPEGAGGPAREYWTCWGVTPGA